MMHKQNTAATSSKNASKKRGQNVAVEWIRQVFDEVLYRPLAGYSCLDVEPESRNHCQATALDLLHLEIFECDRIFGQPQGIKKCSSWVVYVPRKIYSQGF